jgi:uncharacterized membrane protein
MNSDVAPSPTPDERTLAMLAHILQFFSWFIAPLLIYLSRRESPFVAFHALQALILQGVFTLAVITPLLVWKVLMAASIAMNPDMVKQIAPPAWFLIVSPMMWLCWGGVPLITLILGISYGTRAYKGEWAAYPIIGRWAQRRVKV